MEKSKKSLKRLDKHQTDCNGLSNRLNKTINLIKTIRPSTKDMHNIVAAYRNKVLEIDKELEQESIDFWDGDFELRKVVIFKLQEYLGIGMSNILRVGEHVLSISKEKDMTKTTKKRKSRYINKAIFNLDTAIAYIENYNIKDNINETLLEYFINTEYKNNLFQIFSKMKENLEFLGLKDQYFESEVLKIIEYREQNKNNYNKDELLKELYENLENKEEINTDKIRVRTL